MHDFDLVLSFIFFLVFFCCSVGSGGAPFGSPLFSGGGVRGRGFVSVVCLGLGCEGLGVPYFEG